MPRPTSTHEQRESVRLLALAVGVREAARKLGLNENRVMQWSARFNWFPQPIEQKLAPTMKSDLVSTVSKVADAYAETLENDSKSTKLGLSSAVRKAAERFQSYTGEKVISKSKELVNVASAGGKIHGWENATGSNALNLNVLSGGRAVVQVKQG